MRKLLLIGLGDLGRNILEFLARIPEVPRIIVADINEDRGTLLVNNAVMGAMAQGFSPHIEFVKVDLNNEEETEHLLGKVQPDFVINATTLQTWHRIRILPREMYEKLSSATLGAWLPMHLTLVYKLMKAIKRSGINTFVLNASLPDVVDAVLGKIDLAPTLGLGNIDLIVQGIKRLVSLKLNVSVNVISVYMVAHHVHWVCPREAGYMKGAPYFLKILVKDKDVTKSFNLDKLLVDAVKLYPPGMEFTTVSASSGIKNVMAILKDKGILTHVPGPNGLPGGYPVYLDGSGAKVTLPDDLALADAVKINEEAQKYDAIEKIEEDGTVVFADYAVQIMKEMLGYECKKMKPEESEQRANELRELYRKFEAKYVSQPFVTKS